VKREVLFAGRWGDRGPELFLVGKRVRRVPIPPEHDRSLAIAGDAGQGDALPSGGKVG
jgi:hypothetical protein